MYHSLSLSFPLCVCVWQVTSQAAELLSLSNSNTELQSKLNMAELLAQQLSTESPLHSEPSANLTNRLDELREEVERLEGVVRSVDVERDQALSDIDALRDAMMQQQLEATGKVSECIVCMLTGTLHDIVYVMLTAGTVHYPPPPPILAPAV